MTPATSWLRFSVRLNETRVKIVTTVAEGNDYSVRTSQGPEKTDTPLALRARFCARPAAGGTGSACPGRL
jgi:hypothetical protein